MESEAVEAAIVRVQEMLKHPDDLITKLGPLRKKMAIEKASIEAQLRTAIEGQMEDAQKGLDTLLRVKNATGDIKKSLAAVHQLGDNPSSQIRNYEKIKKISRTHQNFQTTKEMVESFQKLNSQVEQLQERLQLDAKREDGMSENLLIIHYQLQQLESFRNSTMERSKGCSSEVLNSLHQYFKQVDSLTAAFETHMWSLARRTVELVKKSRFTTIIRIAQIIETEEKLDAQAALVETSATDSLDELSPNTQVKAWREIKSYRIKYLDTIRDGISTQIKDLYASQKSDLSQLLESAEKIIEDLMLIHDELEPRFPKKYNIFQFFVLEYHRSIYDMVNSIISETIEAGAILMLLRWVRDYYASMSGRLGVGEELLEPRLLDDREDDLILEYIKLVRLKLSEWLNNLLNTETRDFLERPGPPEVGANGIYVLSGSVIVFQMFNQQLDVVSSSSHGALMFDVVVECCSALDEFQKAWTRTLDTEFQKFLEKPADTIEGFPEYVLALANDSMRSTEFAEVIIQRMDSLMDEPFKAQATLKIKASLDGFMKLAKRCYGILIDIVLRDVLPVLIKFYLVEWYDLELVRYITGTLEDYINDFQDHMHEYLFSKFTTELQERFLVLYIESFRNKGAKFKLPTSIEKMKTDLESIVEFFSRFKTAKRVKASFEVVEKIIAMIESNPRLVFLEFYSLWKTYPDVPLSFVEDLLHKRDDLDRSAAREAVEQCKAKVMEEKEKNPGKEWPVSLFSKLAK